MAVYYPPLNSTEIEASLPNEQNDGNTYTNLGSTKEAAYFLKCHFGECEMLTYFTYFWPHFPTAPEA